MTFFKDAEDVYGTLADLFEEILVDEKLGSKMKALNIVMHVRYRDPDADITLDTTVDPPTVTRGAVPDQFDAWMEMDADVGHRFWLGKLNVAAAMARGQIKTKGGVARLMRMVPVMKPAFGLYRTMLEDRGRTDLLEAIG